MIPTDTEATALRQEAHLSLDALANDDLAVIVTALRLMLTTRRAVHDTITPRCVDCLTVLPPRKTPGTPRLYCASCGAERTRATKRRSAAAHPDWPSRVRGGRPDDDRA